MLRSLVFAIKVGLFAVAAIWIAQRPGTVQIDWLGYNISAHVGLVLLAVLFIVALLLFFHRLVLFFTAMPEAMKDRKARKYNRLGMRSVSKGLAAVAAGDTAMAAREAASARIYLPDDTGLTLLLEAQAARLKGDEDDAATRFRLLLNNKDTAFLGIRGLLGHALDRGDRRQALTLARQGLDMYPRQGWMIRMVYDLEIAARDWDNAEKTLRRGLRYEVFSQEKADSDRIAMLVAQAEDASARDDENAAAGYLRKALKLDESFSPVVSRLADIYWVRGNKRAIMILVENAWRVHPHVDLLAWWEKLAPPEDPKNSGKRMKWFERLVAFRPDNDESQMAVAAEAIRQKLWGEARQYLDMAEQIRPSARLYRMRAQAERLQGHEDAARLYQDKADQAPAGKVWTCRETGQVYERWVPVVPPRGLFNTISWGYPAGLTHSGLVQMMPHNEIMMIEK